MTQLVSKQQAAVRQLEEAIWLLFEERDAVAIHTLAAAAHQIAHDLARHQGKESFLRSRRDLLGAKGREWVAAISVPENFAKHADRDPDHVMDYSLGLSETFILDAIRTLVVEVGSDITHSMVTFLVYFQCSHPGVISDPSEPEIADLVRTFPIAKAKPLWLEILRRRPNDDGLA